MKKRCWLIMVAPGLLLSACALAPAPAPTATQTATLRPTATDTRIPPSPTDTPAPAPSDTPTATPFIPFNVVVASTDAANLRAGPGYLFLVLRVIQPGTKLLLLGRAPGSEWFYVQVNDYLKGWVFGKLLKQNEDMLNAPIVEPADSKLIGGRVQDVNGIPIRGVGFTVVQRNNPGAPGNVVLTDANGEFFSFMPLSAGGVYTVTYAAIACDSNVWKDPECTYYKDGYLGMVEPPARDVRLPQTEILEFTWK